MLRIQWNDDGPMPCHRHSAPAAASFFEFIIDPMWTVDSDSTLQNFDLFILEIRVSNMFEQCFTLNSPQKFSNMIQNEIIKWIKHGFSFCFCLFLLQKEPCPPPSDLHFQPDPDFLSGDTNGDWSIMMYPSVSFTYSKVWWCLMMFDDVWWCLMMFDDVWWCLMVFDDVWWC